MRKLFIRYNSLQSTQKKVVMHLWSVIFESYLKGCSDSKSRIIKISSTRLETVTKRMISTRNSKDYQNLNLRRII